MPGRLPWDVQASEMVPCEISNSNEATCLAQECCWVNGSCFRKSRKCYADFREEECPPRIGWRPNNIYTGWTLNGTYCFIESILSYTTRYGRAFGGATSLNGVRILHGDADPCVIRRETFTEEIAPGICNVREAVGGEMNGTIYLNKCVLRGTSGLIAVRDFGHRNSCVCKINAWEADEIDVSGVSQEIRDIVVVEEHKSTCSRILGRMLRNSWRRHVNIVNKEEVDVVVRALINITEKTSTSLDIHDAEILLDTSNQISKYKFYDGLDNHSADLLIKSSTKYVSNLLRSVVIQNVANDGSSNRRKRSAYLNDSSTASSDSELIQWKIMRNLEEIAENIVALVDIPKNSSRYIVEAQEEAVDLRVAIAKNETLNSLTEEDASTTVNSTVHSWNAFVTEIPEYAQGDSVAVVTAYYNLSRENVTSDKTRASGVLAINPRVVKNGLVADHISLPVVFTLPVEHGSRKANGSKFLCSYHDESSTNPGTEWLQTGCKVKQRSDDTVTCECTHTTHFAVLMQLHYEELSEQHVTALEYLSIAFGTLSIAALSVTIIVFMCYRQILLTHRTALHLNLAISLLGGYVALLLGSVFSSRHLDHPKTCFGFAIAAHLFFLSTFCWFFMEGIYLFYKVVMVFSTKWGECGAKYAPLLGWGIPVLIVIVSVLTSRNMNNRHGEMGYDDAYYDDRTCFLQSSNGMQWTFLAPAFFVIFINTCVLMKVVSVIFQSSRSSSTKSKTVANSIRTSAKGLILLLPILGIPWIANVFSSLPPPAGIVASYVHVVLMGLQGIAIFLFYCVFNSEVRKAIKLSTERRKSQASIEIATKIRKRSQVPLVNSNNESPPTTRYKNSLTPLSANGRTYTLTSQMSNANEPPSPNPSTGGMIHLSPLREVPTAEK